MGIRQRWRGHGGGAVALASTHRGNSRRGGVTRLDHRDLKAPFHDDEEFARALFALLGEHIALLELPPLKVRDHARLLLLAHVAEEEVIADCVEHKSCFLGCKLRVVALVTGELRAELEVTLGGHSDAPGLATACACVLGHDVRVDAQLTLGHSEGLGSPAWACIAGGSIRAEAR